MANSSELKLRQARAALQEKRDALEKERASIKKEVRKAKAIKDSAQRKDKIRFLDLKAPTLENAYKEVLTAQDNLISILNEDLRGRFEKMRGLVSFAIATGSATPDARLLFDSLGDYLEAKSESDRTAAHRAVNLCLVHGNFDSADREPVADDIDDRILAQFEAISDPAEQSRFYNKHRDEIHRGLDSRKSDNP
jgi:hypothetical protein